VDDIVKISTEDMIIAARSHTENAGYRLSERKGLQKLRSTDVLNKVGSSKVRKPQKLIVGSSSVNNKLKSVQIMGTVDVFVPRLDPHTTVEELNDCINEVKDDLQIKDATCEPLRSRYVGLYSPFHVSISVDALHLTQAVELFMAAES
jgi:hypothetical protein